MERALTILCVSFVIASGEESNPEFGVTNSGAEYLTVFKNIPRLFEYLLEMLDDTPEMLEKNDVTIFKRNADDDDVTREKRNTDDDDVIRDKQNTEDDDVTRFKKNTEDDDDSTKGNIDGNEVQDEKMDNGSVIDEGPWDVSYLGYQLTSAEVAEQAVQVEKMLEDHNASSQ